MDLPTRILQGGASAFERELLASASADAPTPEFRASFAGNLGIASATGLTAAGAGASLKLKVLSSFAWLKWLTIGLSVGMVSVGAASHALSTQEPPATTAQVAGSARKSSARSFVAAEPAMPSVAAARPTSASKTAAPVSADTDAPATPASVAPSIAPLTVALPRGESEPTTPPGTASALREEMAAIQNVRAQLARGDARAASSALNAYDARYPAGVLEAEAQLLRVDTLFALGERDAARALARRLLDAQPNGPYARRLAAAANAARAPNP